MAKAKSTRRPSRRKEPRNTGIRAFTEDCLQCISMPLGGLGTGCVGLGGRGQLRDWEIFNAPNQGFCPDYTVPFIFCRSGSDRIARVLECRLLPPFTSTAGLPPAQLAGMPRLAEAVFNGIYPFGQVEFQDDELPVKITLRAYNPLIPSRHDDSGLPVAILTYKLHNPTRRRVTGTVAWSLQNCVGLASRGRDLATLGLTEPTGLGRNVNEYREEPGLRGLYMTSLKYAPEQIGYGSMALMTPNPRVTVATGWLEAGWWDRAQKVWDDFAADGVLDGPVTPTPPSDDGQSHVGTLGVHFDLAPGESDVVRFVLAWCFPWRVPPSMFQGHRPVAMRNHYAGRFADAWQAGRYAAENLEALQAGTQEYVAALVNSDLPGDVVEAVASQACILKTNTVLWLDAVAGEPLGRIFAYEGCGDQEGCCPMNCTHVWNYEQTLAHLFPALERTLRATDYGENMHDGGAMAFRVRLPLGTGLPVWHPRPRG